MLPVCIWFHVRPFRYSNIYDMFCIWYHDDDMIPYDTIVTSFRYGVLGHWVWQAWCELCNCVPFSIWHWWTPWSTASSTLEWLTCFCDISATIWYLFWWSKWNGFVGFIPISRGQSPCHKITNEMDPFLGSVKREAQHWTDMENKVLCPYKSGWSTLVSQ